MPVEIVYTNFVIVGLIHRNCKLSFPLMLERIARLCFDCLETAL